MQVWVNTDSMQNVGDLAAELENAVAVPYAEIPHFAQSTVSGHAGRLLLGTLEEVPVLVMQGRFHFYEGHSMAALTLPVRVMRMLGDEMLIVTNAAGGVNPAYQPGDFMLIRDHINLPGLAGANPLIGPNEERFGERFPAIAHAYDAHPGNADVHALGASGGASACVCERRLRHEHVRADDVRRVRARANVPTLGECAHECGSR